MTDMEDFWQEKHKESDLYWLTHSGLQRVLEMHELDAPSDKVVLEIGVGGGHMTRALAKNNKVIAVDISEIAIKRLLDVVHLSYLTHQMPLLPEDYVDLAICHLVFQHCKESMVRFIIKSTLRALKLDGAFSFQIAHDDMPTGIWRKMTDEGKLVWHDLDTIKRIVDEEGGKVDWVGGFRTFPNEDNITWDIVRVTKK